MAEDIQPDIERARRGDRAAFGKLVRRYQRRVYGAAFRIAGNHDDARDVAQEAFVRAFRGIGSFDGRADFFTWLYRIVVNTALNQRRRVKRRAERPLEEEILPEPLQRRADGDPARELELKRLLRRVHRAVDALSEGQRAAVVLVLMEGMSYREAAEVLECSEGTVGWRVHEARTRLRQALGDDALVRQFLGRGKEPQGERARAESGGESK